MKKRPITLLTLGFLACGIVSGGLPYPLMGVLPAQAATHSGHNASATHGPSATGLDAKSLLLANRGNWSEFVKRLQSECDGEASPSLNHAWLAFGLMFLDKNSELSSLAEKVQGLPPNPQVPDAPKLVAAFNLMAQKKFEDSSKLLAGLSDNANGVLSNLALAALSAKTGDTQKAIDYCELAVKIGPDFGWGYRTMGYLQGRWLKNTDAAEATYAQALSVQPDANEVRDLLVDSLLSHKDFDDAIDVAQAGIKIAPTDEASFYRLSRILTKQFRLREADAQLDKSIRLAPDNPKYHRAKASILRDEKHLNEAIAEQQKALDLSTDKAFELTELAALNELAGNDSAAADNLKAALAIAPVSQAEYQAAHQKLVVLLTRGKRYEDLVAEFRRAQQLEPDNAYFQLGLAEALMKCGKLDEAKTALINASNKDATDTRSRRLLGALYMQKGDFAHAAAAYTAALNINPMAVDDLTALGYAHAFNQDYKEAETAFVTALAVQQLTQAQADRAGIMRAFGALLLQEGRYNEASLNYAEVVRQLKGSSTQKQDAFCLAEAKALCDRTTSTLNEMMSSWKSLPVDEKGPLWANMIEALLRLDKSSMALEQLAAVPAEQTSSQKMLTLQARAYRLHGDTDKALEYAIRATTADEKQSKSGDGVSNIATRAIGAEALVEQGLVLIDKGDLNGAESAFHKAADLDEKSYIAYDGLGRLYLKRNETDRVMEAAKRALAINPYYAHAYILTGDAMAATNKFDQAVLNYKHAVELYPAFIEAHRILRDAYKKHSQNDEAQKEDQTISQLEKTGLTTENPDQEQLEEASRLRYAMHERLFY